MEREEAIARIAAEQLAQLSDDARAEQLEAMVLEGWEDDPDWDTLPEEVRAEMATGDFTEAPSNERYNAVLLFWLKDEMLSVSNRFLANRLNVPEVVGDVEELYPCPCCGSRTISEPGELDICEVCWWEDDGKDNATATETSEVNTLSLAEGRTNYIRYGIFHTERMDLLDISHEREMYEDGRQFTLTDDKLLKEVGTDWELKVEAKK